MTDLKMDYKRLVHLLSPKSETLNLYHPSINTTNYNDQLTHVSPQGYAHITANTPNFPQSHFEISSLNISFSFSTLLQLQEEVRLSFHAPGKIY